MINQQSNGHSRAVTEGLSSELSLSLSLSLMCSKASNTCQKDIFSHLGSFIRRWSNDGSELLAISAQRIYNYKWDQEI